MRKTNDTTKTRELTEAELAAVSGSGMQNAFSNTIKTIGQALQTMASKQ
jgi:hypothetical protein